MSGELTSTVWGIAPWSTELIDVSRAIDKGREPLKSHNEQFLDDFVIYHDALEEADITYRAGDWGGGTLDYFRDTVKGSDGFEDGIDNATVRRWFDRNAFFHEPKIVGPLNFWKPRGDDYYQLWLETDEHASVYQPTLLSPYAFMKLSARAEGINEEDAFNIVSHFYDGILDASSRQGVRNVLLHEPFAAYHQVNKLEQHKLHQLIGGLAGNHSSIEVGVFFSFGDGAELVREFAYDDRVAAIGCDLEETSPASLPALPEHRFLAGIIVGDNTLIQRDAEVLDKLSAVSHVTQSPEISVTHNVDLVLLPRASAIKKIGQIGRLGRDPERSL